MIERYRQLSDLPPRVRLFPLRGCILLPRANLPLNVFEPRYIAMVDQALAGDRAIAIIQPKLKVGHSSDDESPASRDAPLQSIGCVGRITGFQEIGNGRMTLSLTGISRFKLTSETDSDEPFRSAQVAYGEFAKDLQPGYGEHEAAREKILQVLKAYLTAKSLSADWDNIGRASTEQLVNALSVLSPFGPQEKQALLESPDLKSRAETLIALAEMELAAGGGESGGTLQ